uniref:ORFuMS n=1 Tax=Streptomyces arenae TaxID=29301 RepID=P72363_STRAE|nr:ORFuMS [Streptomyces arenae]
MQARMTDNQDGHGEQVAGLLLRRRQKLGGRPKRCWNTGRPLVEHAVEVVRRPAAGRIHVVLGAARTTSRPSDLSGCVTVGNPGWAEGMGCSLRADWTHSGYRVTAALVSLVDQPGIDPALRPGCWGAFEDENSLVSAAYEGCAGIRCLFGAAHWAGITASADRHRGARPTCGTTRRAQAWWSARTWPTYDIDTEAPLSHLE